VYEVFVLDSTGSEQSPVAGSWQLWSSRRRWGTSTRFWGI